MADHSLALRLYFVLILPLPLLVSASAYLAVVNVFAYVYLAYRFLRRVIRGEVGETSGASL